MFISIEGIEGAGKSSLATAIVEFLKRHNKQVLLTREPGGTPIAESIRHVLLHAHPTESLQPKAELMLMFASRVQHVETLIKPALKKGMWVVCDRFADASFAYQGGGRKLGVNQVELLSQYALNGFKPDLTLLLDLDVNLAFNRLQNREKDKIEQESLDFFAAVRQAYLQQAKLEPERVQVLNASLTEDQVIKNALQCLQGFINA